MTDTRTLYNSIPAKARLTIFSLFFAGLAVIISMIYILTFNAANQITSDTDDKLELLNRSLAISTQTWLNYQVKALEQLTRNPDIISMNPARQRPHLQNMARTYGHMYLVSTTDLQGMNIARSDDISMTDYKDRPWFQGAKSGHTTFQSLISRTTTQPALVVSVPVKTPNGSIVGVAMFAAHLTELSRDVQTSSIGKTGYAYVIDDHNRVILHPDKDLTTKFQDFSQDPPIAALRNGTRGLFEYTDPKGVTWRTYLSVLNNGWGIVVKQKQEETLAPLNDFQHIAIAILLLTPVFLLLYSWLMIRHALKPIIESSESSGHQ